MVESEGDLCADGGAAAHVVHTEHVKYPARLGIVVLSLSGDAGRIQICRLGEGVALRGPLLLRVVGHVGDAEVLARLDVHDCVGTGAGVRIVSIDSQLNIQAVPDCLEDRVIIDALRVADLDYERAALVGSGRIGAIVEDVTHLGQIDGRRVHRILLKIQPRGVAIFRVIEEAGLKISVRVFNAIGDPAVRVAEDGVA